MKAVMTADELLAAYRAADPDEPLASTGVKHFDAATGGLFAGQVWIVVGRPGEGRTTLLTQLSTEVALRGHPVQLATPREPASWVASRCLSRLGVIPLSAVVSRDVDENRLTRGIERLRDLPIEVFPIDGPQPFTPETDPWRQSSKGKPGPRTRDG